MIPVKVLAVRYLANATPALSEALGAPKGYPALAMLTTDSDDATYIALDEATKAADVKVCYGRSFYAGAANAFGTPFFRFFRHFEIGLFKEIAQEHTICRRGTGKQISAQFRSGNCTDKGRLLAACLSSHAIENTE